MNDASIALQLYTVRDETERDFQGTLTRVAEIGYKNVEFAGYGGLSASTMAALLADNGLSAASTHVKLKEELADFDQDLDYCQAIGCSYLVVPWVSPETFTPEALPKLAETLNTYGLHAQERGIRLGYHNHNFEFASRIDGRYAHEQLMALTDPQAVTFELDTFWVAHAGVDPVAYLRMHAGRIALVHLKDMTPDHKFIEVGSGTLPTKKIIATATAAGASWFIVENDAPTIPSLESVTRSLAYLHKL